MYWNLSTNRFDDLLSLSFTPLNKNLIAEGESPNCSLMSARLYNASLWLGLSFTTFSNSILASNNLLLSKKSYRITINGINLFTIRIPRRLRLHHHKCQEQSKKNKQSLHAYHFLKCKTMAGLIRIRVKRLIDFSNISQ